MQKSHLKTIIITGVVAVLLIGLPLFFWGRYQGYRADIKSWQLQTPEPAPSPALQTYTSPSGFFAFKYPKGYSVSESIDPENSDQKIIFIYRVDGSSPVMQITILRKYAVTFSSWEGKEWSEFEDVVHSFVFSQK